MEIVLLLPAPLIVTLAAATGKGRKGKKTPARGGGLYLQRGGDGYNH